MTSKYTPIYAVYKVFYMDREDPSSDIVVREVLKGFATEIEAQAYIRTALQTQTITREELEQGWDMMIEKTTLEQLWAEIQLNAAMDE